MATDNYFYNNDVSCFSNPFAFFFDGRFISYDDSRYIYIMHKQRRHVQNVIVFRLYANQSHDTRSGMTYPLHFHLATG